jgi:hypothetical protein
MHPNKKRKPKHTAVFRYDNSGYAVKVGGSRKCKASSINPMRVQGYDYKYNRYETYSKTVWQEIKFVYTAKEPRKRRRV